MRSARRLRHNIGFTLIELIMTIVILSIAAIPISLTIFKQVESAFYSQDLTLALNLARFEMERVYLLPFASVTNASFSNFLGYDYDVTRTISYVQGSGASVESLKQADISVSKHGSSDVLVTFSTYIAKNVSYGL